MNMYKALARIEELNKQLANDEEWLSKQDGATETVLVETVHSISSKGRWLHIKLPIDAATFIGAVKGRIEEMEQERDKLKGVVDMAEAALKGVFGGKE